MRRGGWLLEDPRSMADRSTDQPWRPVKLLSFYGEKRARRHHGEERGGEYDGSYQLERV